MNIIKVHGRGVEFEKTGKAEGWKIVQVEDAHFAKKVIFDNDNAKLLFLLRYQ